MFGSANVTAKTFVLHVAAVEVVVYTQSRMTTLLRIDSKPIFYAHNARSHVSLDWQN